jgi:hypothetical protein
MEIGTMNKKSNFLLKSTTILLPLALLLVAGSVNNQQIFADANTTKSELHQKQASTNLDVSQGWTIKNYSSNTQPDVSKIFLQGVDMASATQRGILVQAANVGDASLTAQKVISMKKGHKYDLNLIYAQFYDNGGTGYIDFNGKKVMATSDYSDQNYKEEITPTEDMNYTITVSFTTKYPGNAYLKLGYDKKSSGITDIPTELDAPVVSSAPEAGTNLISGTADSGNTVVASDTNGVEIGTAKVGSDGKFEIKTNRILRYEEKLRIVQKNDTQTSPITEVLVVDTVSPSAPILNKITDEDKEISGTAEPYSTVEVTFTTKATSATYSGKADDTGKFKITLDQTFNGKTKIVAKVTDEGGLSSPETHGEVVFAKALNVSLKNKVSSISTSISGKTSRANCAVTISFDSRIYKGQSDEQGNFNIPITLHSPGENFVVEAKDPIDPENPATTSDIVLPRIPAFNTLKAGMTVLKGEADPDAEISLKITKANKDIIDLKATADDQGKFEIPLKDKDGKVISLAIGDELKYNATLSAIGLTSEDGFNPIYSLR